MIDPIKLPKRTPGVYVILNTVDGKLYVGRSACMYKRAHQYLYDFRERKIGHLNNHLFNAMKHYGIEKFVMYPIEFCANEVICERELFWIDKLKTTERSIGYNLRRDTGSRMIVHPETSAKISGNLKEQWLSGARDEHGAKLKASWSTAPDRRVSQSRRLSKTLTKYEYLVVKGLTITRMRFQALRLAGLESALSSFHRSGSNVARLKGYIIVRIAA